WIAWQGLVAPRWLAGRGLPVRGWGRPARAGRGGGGEDPVAGHPTRLDGRARLARPGPQSPGVGLRHGGPQAVRLPSALRGVARKWGRVVRYARMLPRVRAATDQHLARPELDRLKVLATVVRLTNRGFFRVGSERYAVRNRTFGICTLRKSHVEVRGDTLIFTYPGKRRKDQRQVVAGTPLAAIVSELLALPGSRLFRYRDGNQLRNVTARAVNRYLRSIAGERCTSKDMRTFGGTV